jgi:hypothetical protein
VVRVHRVTNPNSPPERRIDIIELREFCRALGITLAEFVTALERDGAAGRGRRSE